MPECFYHTGRPAVARCKQCGRGVCSQCRIVTDNGIFCSEKCRETFAVFQQRLKEAEEKRAAAQGNSARWRQVIFLIILLAAIIFFLKKFLW
ncbi:MAG: hypothetical protein NC911_08905 [Candidatus Omnitrophica bacterium]|nr:hypothetical protein [Candidatus Omnitrophota bacterium]